MGHSLDQSGQFLRSANFRSVDGLRQTLASMSSEELILTPARRASKDNFSAGVTSFELPTIKFFTIEGTSIYARIPPTHKFIGFTFPVINSIRTPESKLGSDQGYAVMPDSPLDIEAERYDLICANFFGQNLSHFGRLLNGFESRVDALTNKVIDPKDPNGALLRRYLTYMFSEARAESPVFSSPVLSREIEEILYLIVADLLFDGESRPEVGNKKTLDIAREFVMANLDRHVLRVDIASAAEISIRSLTRLFRKEFGVGPMQWARTQRLLEARRLLVLKGPEENSITDIAIQCGFVNLSTFSRQYKMEFGELPSNTLRRK